MALCGNCAGEGIVGNGDHPWLKQGALSTCKECSGTGQVSEGDTSSSDVAGASDEVVSSDGGDNSPKDPGTDGGSQSVPEQE